MSKVYVVNKGGHDYSDAAKFGELVYCTDGLMDKFDTSMMYRELNAALKDSESEDYILLTSLSALCSVASAIFAAKHNRLNLLIFRGDGYAARKLVFDNDTKEENDRRIEAPTHSKR